MRLVFGALILSDEKQSNVRCYGEVVTTVMNADPHIKINLISRFRLVIYG